MNDQAFAWSSQARACEMGTMRVYFPRFRSFEDLLKNPHGIVNPEWSWSDLPSSVQCQNSCQQKCYKAIIYIPSLYFWQVQTKNSGEFISFSLIAKYDQQKHKMSQFHKKNFAKWQSERSRNGCFDYKLIENRMKYSSQGIKIFLVLLSTCILMAHGCLNDTRCADCQSYFITIGGSLFLYYNCDRCVQNRTLNVQTNICECMQGYYQTDSASCERCPATCASCKSASVCTSCYYQYNRILVGESCNCIDGYESKTSDFVCKQKPNVLMIVLSTIGSAICMVLGFIVCAFIRMRRGSQQIHAQTRKRNNSLNAQIEIHCSDYMENTSNMFWNAKSVEYKEEQLCSICLDGNPLFITECGHYFHAKCIYGWLTSKATCPNCNKETEQKYIRRWCERCKKVLMPVVMNITIKRPSTKRKKQVIQSTPVESQYCDVCQHEDATQQALQNIQKPCQIQEAPQAEHQV